MCIYPEGKVGAACKGFLNVPFTDGEIEAIVDMHNTIRNKVALGLETRGDPGPLPQASNMKALEWDHELALVAGRWADQCIFTYDICRDVARYPVGQNIAKGSYAFNNAISFIFDWYDSVDMLKEEDIRFFKIKSTDALSQFTQLIWAETYQIGCARVVFQQANGANVTYREQFICNYGPTGNIPSQTIYKIGEPCSNCADGTACTVEYQGLCGREMAFDISLERHVEKKNRVQNDDNGSRFGGSNIFLNIFYYTLSMYVILL
nr:venom allergen 3-like [Leptinotarsa decemlineata]